MTAMVVRGIKFPAAHHLTWTRRMTHGWTRQKMPGNLQVIGR